MTDPPPSQASRPWWAPAVAIVAPGGTVELASLPAVQQELYQAAAADPEAFEAVRCSCALRPPDQPMHTKARP